MRKIILSFSLLFILAGILIHVISNLFEAIMPKLGYIAYQMAAAGSYSPSNYELDLSSNYGWSSFSIFVGVLGIICLLFEKRLLEFIGKNKWIKYGNSKKTNDI